MKLGETEIRASFAEAFGMKYARLIITAHDQSWVQEALAAFTGYAASIIACDLEAARERWLTPQETPDGRPGASVLLFGFSTDALAAAVPRRVGQCVMTCATSAVFDGLPEASQRLPLGSYLRYFGDGFQQSRLIGERRYWRLPVMDGEFLVEDSAGVEKGVAGGALILEAVDIPAGLAAVRRAATAVSEMPGIIAPFPGGAARSGSKVGSRYKGLRASTNQAYCPTLRGRAESLLDPRATCAYEIVLDGVSPEAIEQGMARATRAAAGPGILAISAANYGGNLGKYQFLLHDLLARHPESPTAGAHATGATEI